MAMKRKRVAVDHYSVLGLPSGEEGAKLSEKEISRAYRLKALMLHPDKRRDDPDAHDKFQKLRASYEILKNQEQRKLFDDLLRAERAQAERDAKQRQLERDAKRRKKMADLEREAQRRKKMANLERDAQRPKMMADLERDAKRRKLMADLEEKAADLVNLTRTRDEEEMVTRKILEEFVRIHTLYTTKTSVAERMLIVTWEEKIGGEEDRDYTAETLKMIFGRFGSVESARKYPGQRSLAVVLMASKIGAVTAARSVVRDLSISLLKRM